MARTQRKKIRILDEGVEVTQDVDSLNFLGSSLNVSASQNNVTVDDTTAVVGPASATDGGVALFDGTTGKLLKNSTNFVQTAAGTVGIGTLTPDDFLEVKSNSALIPTVAFYNSTGTNTFKVLENGNVGIGTTGPLGVLQLRDYSSGTGEPTYHGDLILQRSVASSEATGGIEFKVSSSGNGYGWKISGLNDANVGLAFATRQGSATWSDKMYIAGNGNVGIGTTVPTIRLQVETDANSGQGIFTRNNNTGSNASSQVSVNTNAGALSMAAFTITHSVWPLTGLFSASAGLTNGMALNTATSAPIAFLINNSERARISASGNLGIGTANPQAKLETAGSSVNTGYSDINIITGNSVNTGYYNSLAFRQNSTNTGARITSGNNGSYRGFLAFETSRQTVAGHNTVEAMRIDGNGNVGIGTTAPGYKLEVYGTDAAGSSVAQTRYSADIYGPYQYYTKGRAAGTSANANDFAGGFIWQAVNSASVVKPVAAIWGVVESPTSGAESGAISFLTTTNGSIPDVTKEKMRITSTGNVGIGTTSPTAVLHLKAGGTAAGTAPLKLTTQAAGLTSVEQGTFELIGNSLQFTQILKRRGINMTQDVITADTTVGNTTTESAALITAEHGANYLEVGKMEEIRIIGTIQQKNAGGGTLSIRTKYAGTTILTTTTNTGHIASGTPFEIVVSTTCRSIGATGTMQINCRFSIDGVLNVPDASALVTIDTTIAQNTTVTAQWSVADTSNTITVNQGYVHCIETNK